MIENIAADISKRLNHLTTSHDFDHLIGMRDHMERMKLLLRLDLDEVRMIGIWGPPGIGKTTIARFMLDQISSYFQNSAIMVNIRGSYPRPCLDEYNAQLQLQKQMLSEMINQKDIVIRHLGVAQVRLKEKKVFLVLDDVDRSAQLDALAKNVQWFGPGSRIIITTEDLKLLKAHGIDHIYKMNFPSTDEALQMFCMYAFGQKTPKDGFALLAHEITYLVGQLPLAIKVMGSFFRGLSIEQWSMEVPRLRTNLNREIENILKFSYDALCEEDKYLFLHIACLFNGESMERVEEYLAESFNNVRQRLHVLTEKSLISIPYHYIYMDNLLAQLGKEIVHKQYVREPGQCQFLVDEKDIREVFADYTTITTRSVIGIDSKYPVNITEKAFEGMSNLQFIKLTSTQTSIINSVSSKLRLLHWSFARITSLSFIINLEFLVELNMVYSKLEKMWDGTKLLPNLKWMYLQNSVNLKELPNLSTATSLKELDVSGCSSLVELPSSIGNAINLENLYLSECSSLVEIPSSIGNATNLKIFYLRKCTSLVELPSSIGNATNLENLDLSDCSSLVELPSSIGNATNLQKLNLGGCSSLVELPFSIGNLTNLQNLDLGGCSSLLKLPSSIGNATNLMYLNLSDCSSLMELPSSTGNLHKLWNLYLGGCSNLVELPSSIGNATNLKNLDLSECSSLVELPSSIGNATNLEKLDLRGCTSLVELPSSIGKATNLLNLDLSECSSLLKLPSSIGNAKNLMHLNLTYCSSLVELPYSIGKLHKLWDLYLQGCSKLKALPININMESLKNLDLSGCSSLKSFPEISTNIERLNLSGTLIRVVPWSIRSWPRLYDMCMPYIENLNELPYTHTKIKKLYLTDAGIQELGPWVRRLSRLRSLVLNGMKNLVSLPQLPASLLFLKAENCESLERLDCSFYNNIGIHLIFQNCFKLNQEARDLIIYTSTYDFSVLPGAEVPPCFTYKASGSSVTVKLNQKPRCSSTIFKACILFVNNSNNEAHELEQMRVFCNITSKQNVLIANRSYEHILEPVLLEHLYIFDFDAENVTSTELVFEFVLNRHLLPETLEIKECGVLHVFEEGFTGCNHYEGWLVQSCLV